MQNQEQELRTLEKAYKDSLELNKKLKRLFNNPDFIEIILNGFCKDDCALYMTKATNPLLHKEDREISLEYAKAGGCLSNYFSFIERNATIADQELPKIEEELEQLEINK